MNYFNYFEECGASKSGSGKLSFKHVIGLLIIVLVGCSVIYAYNYIKLASTEKSIKRLEAMDANEAFNHQYEMAGVLSDQLQSAEEYLTYLKLLDDSVMTFNTANKELFDVIDSCMAGGFVDTINVNGLLISIEGYAANIDIISTIERQFREQPYFSAVNISSFEQEEADGGGGYIRFSVQVTLMGGAIKNEQ